MVPRYYSPDLETLPVELFNLICNSLSLSDLGALCRVSRRCHCLTIPWLFHDLDIYPPERFTSFLQLWQDGWIPHEHLKHVRRFVIRGNEYVPRIRESSEEGEGDYIPPHWLMLVDLVKSGVMTGLLSVVVDGQSELGFEECKYHLPNYIPIQLKFEII